MEAEQNPEQLYDFDLLRAKGKDKVSAADSQIPDFDCFAVVSPMDCGV